MTKKDTRIGKKLHDPTFITRVTRTMNGFSRDRLKNFFIVYDHGWEYTMPTEPGQVGVLLKGLSC
jgi:hypothetical protein